MNNFTVLISLSPPHILPNLDGPLTSMKITDASTSSSCVSLPLTVQSPLCLKTIKLDELVCQRWRDNVANSPPLSNPVALA